MSIEKITAAEVESKSVERLSNRPGDRAVFGKGGLSASQLKTFFSALAKLSIDKVNEIIDALGNGKSESDFMSLLYTSLADTQDDERKLSLSKWVEQTEQKLVDVPGVMAEMKSVIDGFTEASATATYVGSDQLTAMHLHNEIGENGVRDVRFEFLVPRSELFIYKTYETRVDMSVGAADDNVPVGGLVLCKSMRPEIPEFDYAALCEKYYYDRQNGLPESGYEEKIRLTGLSAYEVALDNDPDIASREDWLASLKGEQGPEGPQGKQGPPFMISKTFSSVDEMHAGAATDGVLPGQYVAIDTNVENEDSAKVFLKKEDLTYVFVVDLSGKKGIQGPQGPQGDNIIENTELPQEWYEVNEKLEEDHRIMGGLIYKDMDGVVKVTPLAPPYGVREDECGVAMNALAMYNSKQQILCKPPTDERHAVNLGYLLQELKKYVPSGGGTVVGDLKVTGGDLITDYVQISKIGHETSSSYGRVLTLSTSGYARYRTLGELASDLGAVTEDWVKNYVQNAIAAIPNAKGVSF